VEQARQHGANVVTHTLRLDYNALKRRLSGSASPSQEPSPASFVELVGGAGAGADEYIIEFEASPTRGCVCSAGSQRNPILAEPGSRPACRPL
jgi:hypothetical protein